VANIASAEKRNRQRLRRRARNLAHLSKVRSTVKKVVTATTGKDSKAKELLAEAVKVLASAAQKGVLKRKTASRKISRLTKALNAAGAAAAAAPVIAASKSKKAPAKRKAAPKAK
jgi:small subunit ribosomal protein S20